MDHFLYARRCAVMAAIHVPEEFWGGHRFSPASQKPVNTVLVHDNVLSIGGNFGAGGHSFHEIAISS